MRQQKWWDADVRKHLEAAGITREALYRPSDLQPIEVRWRRRESNPGPRVKRRCEDSPLLVAKH